MSTRRTRSMGKAEPVNDISVDMKRSKPVKKTQKKTSKAKSASKEDSAPAEIIEKGFIYFFYKPKLDTAEVNSLSDVQRLFVVLWPQGHMYKPNDSTSSTTRNIKRILEIPKKSLPDEKKHARFWGYVATATRDLKEVDEKLDPIDYETKTGGPKHLEGARPVGEGVYSLLSHDKHTHLAYVLEIPKELGEVQKAMHISHESSMIITVKNPRECSKDPGYPSHLSEVFHGRYAPANPPELLDYEGVEFILIGASDDIVAELGEAGEEVEHMAEIDAKRITDDSIFQELHLNKKDHPVQALEGDWV